jgi:hypothetical protein
MSLADNAKEYLEKARKEGLEGTSDETAVLLPAQFTTAELEKFFEFSFLQG